MGGEEKDQQRAGGGPRTMIGDGATYPRRGEVSERGRDTSGYRLEGGVARRPLVGRAGTEWSS
jgi:hypothetical protein